MSESLYTAHSTGRNCDTTAPPPPYLWFQCGQNKWDVSGPCPVVPTQSPPFWGGGGEASAGPLSNNPQMTATAEKPRMAAQPKKGVVNLWWTNDLNEPPALAVRRWSSGTVAGWTGILRDVGRLAAHWPDLNAMGVLAKYLVKRATMGQHPSTLRGVVSALCMAEKLGCIPLTVQPVHWLMAQRAAAVTATPRPRQV